MIKQRAFTLVELSIVLVIIGLLVGGVLTGQSLIRAAELRSVSSQLQRYQAAVMTFRDKYFALPGDMTNATAYWGTATNCPGTSAQPSTTAATCNGDGDGKLSVAAANSDEVFRFWQHLANAGLIEGNYTGVPNSSATSSASTTNVPSGRISSSLWYIFYWGTLSGSSQAFDGNYGNAFEFGAPTSNGDPAANILKAEDLYNLDLKLDDGKPATGTIVIRQTGWTGTACTDSTASTSLTANYLLTNTAVACVMFVRNQF